jgi:hypothetical protein
LLFHGIYGKFRADDLAIMAIHTVIRVLNCRRMVTPLIESFIELQDLSGTIFNAIAAPLAAVFDDMHDSPGDPYVFNVKRDPPEFHGLLQGYLSLSKIQIL